MIVDLIVKHWISWILTLICGGLALACKKIYQLYLSEKNHKKTEEQGDFLDTIKQLIEKSAEESRTGDAKLQEQINIIKNGILSLQSRNFKQECRELLQEEHIISLEEFENLQNDHTIYNSLGGNHDGDTLFKMVCKKASHNITDT